MIIRFGLYSCLHVNVYLLLLFCIDNPTGIGQVKDSQYLQWKGGGLGKQ